MFTVFENLVVSVLAFILCQNPLQMPSTSQQLSWFFAHKSERKVRCFYSFVPLLWKSKVYWSISALPYFDQSILQYQVCPSYFHIAFGDCPSLLNSLCPDFNSISAMTLRIPDEFSAFCYQSYFKVWLILSLAVIKLC